MNFSLRLGLNAEKSLDELEEDLLTQLPGLQPHIRWFIPILRLYIISSNHDCPPSTVMLGLVRLFHPMNVYTNTTHDVGFILLSFFVKKLHHCIWNDSLLSSNIPTRWSDLRFLCLVCSRVFVQGVCVDVHIFICLCTFVPYSHTYTWYVYECICLCSRGLKLVWSHNNIVQTELSWSDLPAHNS